MTPSLSIGPELGLGTYGRNGNLCEIIKAAIVAGVRVCDSAPNYRDGSSLADIGRILRCSRCPTVQVTTKVGFFVDPLRAVAQGLATATDFVGNHALTADSIRCQLAHSTQMLGRPPDLVFIHNPERQRAARSEYEFRDLISRALATLEEARDDGLVDSYGVATWADLTDSAARPFSVPWFLDLAESVAGTSHGFEALQIPISLVRIEAVRRAGDSDPIEEAREAGLQVFASSPLHGGELPRMMTPAFTRLFGSDLSAEHACLRFVRSVPGVSTVLFGASSPDQAMANVGFWEKSSPLEEESMQRILNLIA